MDTTITLDPIIPADTSGYQTWMVALPCGREVATCANSREAAIKVWACAKAYEARPARESDLAQIALQIAADTKSWGRLD